MYQSWVFATTLAAGSGLFAYAAITGPPEMIATPQVDAVRVLPPDLPTAIAEPEPEPMVVLEPIVVEARQTPRPKAKPQVAAPSDRPCSSWRELGPTTVTKGKTTGSVSVRELCP